MILDKIIKTMQQAAGESNNSICKKLGISHSSYSLWQNKNLSQIDRLLQICNFCGFTILITNKNNITFDLSEIIDLPDKKNKQNQDK